MPAALGTRDMSHLTLLNDFYKTVWIDGDLASIDRFFQPRTEAHGILADGQVGAEDFKVIVPAFRAMMRDMRVSVDRHVEMDEWLWAHVSLHAVTIVGANPVHAAGMVMMRVENGQVAEAYNSFDFITFFEQIGLLPRDSFALLLSGEAIA